jgi:hypothetical protein
MAKDKQTAPEPTLSALHAQIARVMKNELDVYEAAQKWYLKWDGQPVMDDGEDAPSFPEPPRMPPALLSAITKFLKDNDITAAPEDSDELSELEEALAKKRSTRRANVGNVVPFVQEA